MSITHSSRGRRARVLEDTLDSELIGALIELKASPIGQGPQIDRLLAEQVRVISASHGLSKFLEKQTTRIPTGIVRSVSDTENFWRSIETQFGLLNSTQLAESVGARVHRSYASDQRKAGRLLAVERTNRLLYPGFQIDNGKIRPVISQLLTLGKEHEESEADIIFWLCSPTTYLRGGGRPVDHLGDPELVLETARKSWGAIW